ncbi:MAG: hypothetical protein Q8O13_09245 [Candidatus Omnitrophota bacterium]|nr:hypothetical protein [Candidatus Omnitrophota bacterium]
MLRKYLRRITPGLEVAIIWTLTIITPTFLAVFTDLPNLIQNFIFKHILIANQPLTKNQISNLTLDRIDVFLGILFMFFIILVIFSIWLSIRYIRKPDNISNLKRSLEMAKSNLIKFMSSASRIFYQLYPIRICNYLNQEITIVINKNGDCYCNKDFEIKPYNSSLHMVKHYVSGEYPIKNFEEIELEVKSLDRSGVEFLPIKDTSNEKEFIIFFLPQIELGDETRKYRFSYNWEGQWNKLFKQKTDRWEEDIGPHFVRKITFNFLIPYKFNLDIKNEGEGNGRILNTSPQRDKRGLKTYTWITEDIKPSSKIILKLQLVN